MRQITKTGRDVGPAEEANITESDGFFVGQDLTIQYTIVNASDVAVNITGWTLEWNIRESYTSTSNVLSFTTASGIVLTTPASGILTITVTDTATENLPTGVYVYGLRRTNADNETLLAYGTVTLRPSAAR